MSYLVLYGIDNRELEIDSDTINDTARCIQRASDNCNTECKDALDSLKEVKTLADDIPDLSDVSKNIESLHSEFHYLIEQKIETAKIYIRRGELCGCPIQAELYAELADELFSEIPCGIIQPDRLNAKTDLIKEILIQLGKLRIHSESHNWNSHVLYKGSHCDFLVDVSFILNYNGMLKINTFSIYHNYRDITHVEQELKDKGYDIRNLSEDELTLLEMTNQHGIEAIKAIHKLLKQQ